jgi:hypothetical protein
MPTDVDSYKRNTLSVRGSTKVMERITASASINYARTTGSAVPAGQGNSSVYNQILQTPRDISLLELEDLKNPFNDLEGYYSEFTINPWQVIKNFGATNVMDRLYGNTEFSYKATDWFNLTARIGADLTMGETEAWVPKMVMTGPNSSKSEPGSYGITKFYNREFNTDLIASVTRDITPAISFNGLVGININQREANNLFSGINDLVIPEFYHISNTASTPSSTNTISLRRLMGAYAQANFSYKDYLFLSVSARNDWSSTLPIDNRSFFYPGVNAALDLTSALNVEGSVLSYAKIRASWAQAGKDAGPYNIKSVYVTGNHFDGFITVKAPYAQAIPALEVSNQIGNPDLKPEISTDIELGFDLRFYNNRIGLDATFYQRDVKDNILNLPLVSTTGYTSKVVNIAKLQNKGIELLLTATPLATQNFKWDISVNWSKNVSEVVDLGGPSQLSVGGIGGNALIARVGEPAFLIEGTVSVRDAQGRIVVNAAGLPIESSKQQVLGTTQYKFIGGVTNRLSYKGISLAATVDIRNGGLMYSRTASTAYFAGTTPETTYNNRNPFIIPNSAQQVIGADGSPVRDDNGYIVTTENLHPLTYDGAMIDYWGAGGTDLDRQFLVSKSYVKLRETVISYALPKSILSRTPFGNVEFSLIGRNLLLWVPSENVFIDPEQTTFGNDIGSEFGEFGATPPTRQYGFNIRLTL